MKLAQSRLQELYDKAKDMSREEFQQQLWALRERINLDSQIIIYGTAERHARQKYLAKYGCARWTEDALNTIASFSPLIEIGAGQGHWAKALRKLGVDVMAFDNDSTEQPGTAPVSQVRPGDHTKIGWYPRRTLLLVYPPETDMALQCAQEFRGNYLIYVGEARGGVNANDAFFNHVDEQFDCVHIQDLDPFPRCHERLYVLRRKPEHRTAQPWWAPLSFLW
ncbi:hypothetical protein PTSG_02521 [Salpingoeca rosetta]|uniref:Class I SAM-dependent methyltransferase n=1 Tax=Salpingoeca rosetta (strain ATCC 50818 / BSB-021) TaxID=946362 RepID=F2U2F6_SALR5|nr:uncharacterized protein PTSG_02521 [Salpingoeca rosetta]EGD81808.1 hypothetical protein PTSG_02521 [Salpingoeca rosetta]|eukprot:XP_004997012.1 hypothetical protein PTSG_02521 [Salpingoeca rosetta]